MVEQQVGEEIERIAVMDALVHHCQQEGFGLAIWQLPNSDERHFLVSFQPTIIREGNIEHLPAGFLVAGFEGGIQGIKHFLQADVYLSVGKKHIDPTTFQERLPGFKIPQVASAHGKLLELPFTSEEQLAFEKIVAEAVSQIESGTFRKVVLARKKEVSLVGSISLGQLFDKVSDKYTGTFNSIVHLPDNGTWIGASPEILVSLNAANEFRTVALAGTQKVNGQTEREANWSQKELQEQAYVNRYIVDRFKKIRLREYDDIGPRTVRVGDLFHLKTEYVVDQNEVNFPQLVNTVLDLLHPTSAVCGMPREEAIDFVLTNEGFPRELYGGYLGPVNIQKEIHLYVNLRCAKITDKTASFYAGAGITQDSVSRDEFMETESKMDSLRALLVNR